MYRFWDKKRHSPPPPAMGYVEQAVQAHDLTDERRVPTTATTA